MHRVSFGKDILTMEEDFTSRRRVQQIQRPEEGAFSRSGRAYYADDLSGAYLTVDIFQDSKGCAVGVMVCLVKMSYCNHSACFLGDAS